jgi:TIR domain/SIR2-like domain
MDTGADLAPDNLLEHDWEDLLEYIDDGTVIPIVGQDLAAIKIDGREMLLYEYIAQRLAELLQIPKEALPASPTLNDVASAFLLRHGRSVEIYPHIRRILHEREFEPSDALLALAKIEPFNLFVSLTFDSLLAKAVDAARFAGEPRTRQIAYSPRQVDDLGGPRKPGDEPIVFHLLGKSSAYPNYVTTEEDTLEFLHNLQSVERRPQLLFDELYRNHLLIIGCNFSDWLARFFLRMTKNNTLSAQRGEKEILIDGRMNPDSTLILFLRHFSYNTKFVTRSPGEFALELGERWARRHAPVPAKVGEPNRSAGETVKQSREEPAAEMQAGAVFISYAHEDLAAATQIRDALEEIGVDIWLDKGQLDPGDDYAKKIRRNIKGCSLFLPVLSQNSENRKEGFFRREWRWAADRAEEIAPDVPFIVPVLIDDSPEYADSVPEGFQAVHWTRLPGGLPTAEFQSDIMKQLRRARKYGRA